MSIYLKLKEQPKTIEELMIELFSVLQLGGQLLSVATYSDKDCKNEECDAGRFRSVDDLVTIVQTYFPDATESTIFKKLFELRIDYRGAIYKLQMINCLKIRRPTICFRRTIDTSSYDRPSFIDKSRYGNWIEVARIAGLGNKTSVRQALEERV